MITLNILIPLYLLITLGFFLKKNNFPNQEFWPGLEKMTYFILFPALVFVAILKAPINVSLFYFIILAAVIPALFSGLLQFLSYLITDIAPATFTSMYQGAVRNNTPISLVIIAWLVPDTGLATMAVIILVMVLLNNLTSTLVLLRYGENLTSSDARWWYGLIQNPLIIACALGLVFNLAGFGFPESLLNTIDFLGRSALPFALLMVGAGLKFDTLFKNKFAIVLSSFGKLVLTPVLSWGICLIIGVEADLAKVIIIFSAAPTAVSSYILAKQMGGDAESMAQIVTFQTIATAFTLPIVLLIAQQY